MLSETIAYIVANLTWMALVAFWGIHLTRKQMRRQMELNCKISQAIHAIIEFHEELVRVCKDEGGRG